MYFIWFTVLMLLVFQFCASKLLFVLWLKPWFFLIFQAPILDFCTFVTHVLRLISIWMYSNNIVFHFTNYFDIILKGIFKPWSGCYFSSDNFFNNCHIDITYNRMAGTDVRVYGNKTIGASPASSMSKVL